jgi:hypothetical protein
MLEIDSTLLGLIAAPVLAAALPSRPMLETDSALYDLIAGYTGFVSKVIWFYVLTFLEPEAQLAQRARSC